MVNLSPSSNLTRQMGLLGLTATGICSMIGASIYVVPFMIQRHVPGIDPYVLPTAAHGDKLIGGQDPSAQMHFVIDKIEGAIQSLGGTLQGVVRTRIFIKNLSDWESIARVHGERFRDIQPAKTMIKAELIGEDYLVEMEAEAIVG